MISLFSKIGKLLYRILLWDEYFDEYIGYEEQGISFEEWKNIKITPNKTVNQIENNKNYYQIEYKDKCNTS